MTCEACKGRRYNRETLEVHYRGRSIADVLDLTVDAGARRCSQPTRASTRLLRDAAATSASATCGSARAPTTLSGGEAQRVQARARAGAARDRPHALHPRRAHDRPALRRHAASCSTCSAGSSTPGNTVVVIEHNLDVIKTADYVIDLGPEAGDGGGRVVAPGTPETVARSRDEPHGALPAPRLRWPTRGAAVDRDTWPTATTSDRNAVAHTATLVVDAGYL